MLSPSVGSNQRAKVSAALSCQLPKRQPRPSISNKRHRTLKPTIRQRLPRLNQRWIKSVTLQTFKRSNMCIERRTARPWLLICTRNQPNKKCQCWAPAAPKKFSELSKTTNYCLTKVCIRISDKGRKWIKKSKSSSRIWRKETLLEISKNHNTSNPQPGHRHVWSRGRMTKKKNSACRSCKTIRLRQSQTFKVLQTRIEFKKFTSPTRWRQSSLVSPNYPQLQLLTPWSTKSHQQARPLKRSITWTPTLEIK